MHLEGSIGIGAFLVHLFAEKRDSRAPISLCSPTSNALLCHGHLVQLKMKKLPEQPSFCIYAHFHSTSGCLCAYIQKTSPIGLVLHFGLRRERDSNPRSLSAQRFSRPPQSTTLPSLLVATDLQEETRPASLACRRCSS